MSIVFHNFHTSFPEYSFYYLRLLLIKIILINQNDSYYINIKSYITKELKTICSSDITWDCLLRIRCHLTSKLIIRTDPLPYHSLTIVIVISLLFLYLLISYTTETSISQILSNFTSICDIYVIISVSFDEAKFSTNIVHVSRENQQDYHYSLLTSIGSQSSKNSAGCDVKLTISLGGAVANRGTWPPPQCPS